MTGPADVEGANDAPVQLEPTPPSAWKTWLVPALIVVVVVGLVAIALGRGQANFDPTTPEGAVQEYLQAIRQERWQDAIDVLDLEQFQGCQPHHLSSQISEESFNAVHLGTYYDGNLAYVDVEFRHSDGGVFGGWSWNNTFVLVERDGLWYLTDDPWPYFQFLCSRQG